jgi:hypothetical protein
MTSVGADGEGTTGAAVVVWGSKFSPSMVVGVVEPIDSGVTNWPTVRPLPPGSCPPPCVAFAASPGPCGKMTKPSRPGRSPCEDSSDCDMLAANNAVENVGKVGNVSLFSDTRGSGWPARRALATFTMLVGPTTSKTISTSGWAGRKREEDEEGAAVVVVEVLLVVVLLVKEEEEEGAGAGAPSLRDGWFLSCCSRAWLRKVRLCWCWCCCRRNTLLLRLLLVSE